MSLKVMSLKEKIELVLREKGPLTITELNEHFHTSKSTLEKTLKSSSIFGTTGLNSRKCELWDVIEAAQYRVLYKLMSNYCWDYSFSNAETEILETLCIEGKVEFESTYNDDSYESKLYYLSDDYVHELCSKHTQCCSVCRDFECCDNTNDDHDNDDYLEIRKAHSKHCRCVECDQKRVDDLVNKKMKENEHKKQVETSNSLLSLKEKQHTLNKLINKMRYESCVDISWELILYDVNGIGTLMFPPQDYSKTRIYSGAGSSKETLYIGNIDQCIKYIEANMNRKEFIKNARRMSAKASSSGLSPLVNIDIKKLVQSIKDRTDMYFGTTLIPSKILIDFLNGIEDLGIECSKEIASALVIDLSRHFLKKEEK